MNLLFYPFIHPPIDPFTHVCANPSCCPSHQFTHLFILPFFLCLCSYNLLLVSPHSHWLIFYLFFFLRNSGKPEGIPNSFCHWYRWILKVYCQLRNWAWWRWCSEGQKRLPWLILYFNERCRLASGVQHYSNWHHACWSQRDPARDEAVSRKSTQINKWCYSGKRMLVSYVGKKSSAKKKTNMSFLLSIMHNEMRV